VGKVHELMVLSTSFSWEPLEAGRSTSEAMQQLCTMLEAFFQEQRQDSETREALIMRTVAKSWGQNGFDCSSLGRIAFLKLNGDQHACCAQ